MSKGEQEYHRRIHLCERAVLKAAKAAGLDACVTGEFQGCEVKVDTEVCADGRVIILMGTGYHPRFPKYVTLTVHGVIWRRVNKRVKISGGGLGRSEQKFLPDKISQAWLKKAITQAAQAVRETCTAKNMEKLRKEALAKRRQQLKENWTYARFDYAVLDVGAQPR
jgi:hypothetical protein